MSRGWGSTAPEDGGDVLLVGMLVPKEELETETPRGGSAAFISAVLELVEARQSGVHNLPAVVGVACDEASAESVDYLLKTLEARIVLGPLEADRVEPVVAQAGKRAVVFAPFADGPQLEPSADDPPGLLVSCKPNRSTVQPYLLTAVAEARRQIQALGTAQPESIVAALAISGDVTTTSFASAFADPALEAAGVQRIPYTGGARGSGLVSALSAREPLPNLVVAASAEDAWEYNISAFDSATYARSGTYPYYLLAEKRAVVYRQSLLDNTTGEGFPRQYQRFLGLDYHRDASSVLAREHFEAAFAGRFGGPPDPGLEYAYDCAYLATYAAIAATHRFAQPIGDSSADAIFASIGALQSEGALLPVGSSSIAEVIVDLESGRGVDGSVNLIGTSGDLDFESRGSPSLARRYLSVRAPDGEFYCVDAHEQNLCDTGIVFAADGAPFVEQSSRCACLGAD